MKFKFALSFAHLQYSSRLFILLLADNLTPLAVDRLMMMLLFGRENRKTHKSCRLLSSSTLSFRLPQRLPCRLRQGLAPLKLASLKQYEFDLRERERERDCLRLSEKREKAACYLQKLLLKRRGKKVCSIRTLCRINVCP